MIIISPHNEEIKGPLIFLAGPILGAPDWQSDAIGILGVNPYINVASPRRAIESKGDFPLDLYEEQVAWEHKYLDYAANNGVTLFWLPKPVSDISLRAYAQTSRFELGEAVARHYLKGIRLVVGIEEGFSNERYLRMTLLKKAPKVALCTSLNETCEKALQYFN